MDGNPITKPFCQGCKLWQPTGFYTWEREENPEKRKCKHLKRCERVYKKALKENIQIELTDLLTTQQMVKPINNDLVH